MNLKAAVSQAAFEAKYRQSADPWQFAASPYEQRRYATTLRALTRARYTHVFEPGCSVGVLTERLAQLCGEVEAFDISASAVEQARGRCGHLANVRLSCQSLPDRLPVEGFDLLVLSEIGYYFSLAEWRRIAWELITPMARGATLLAVHWLGVSPDHCLSGDQVHEVLESFPELHLEHAERHEQFRVDRWSRA